MNWFQCTATHANTGNELYCMIRSENLYSAYLKFRDYNASLIRNVTIRQMGARS